MDIREHGASRARRDELVRSVAEYLRDDKHLSEAEARDEARGVLEEARSAAHVGLDRHTRRWWVLLVRGLLGLAVGALFLVRPLTAVITMALVFGAWIFVDGVMAMVAALTGRRTWHLALAGLIGIAVGFLMLARPDLGFTVFYVMAAAWTMARGVTEIALGVKLRSDFGGQIGLTLLGVASLAFGIFLLLAPIAGVMALGWWLGLYALAHGILFVIESFELRGVHRRFVAHAI